MSPDRSSGSNDPSTPVVAVVTHDNLSGLRTLVPSLQAQADSLGWKFVVIDGASSPETKEWLRGHQSTVPTITIEADVGPGGSRNAVVTRWQEADSYFFFDDDVIPRGHELLSLFSALHADAHVGVASGIPLDEDSSPLTTTFTRRPLDHVFPRLWTRWWGESHRSPTASVPWADAVPASAIAVRGAAFRGVAGFDLEFWPAGFEDLDLCAKIRFSGYGVVVDSKVLIFQRVSVTTRKVFGPHYPLLQRSSGVLYAVVDYPVSVAVGRLARALVEAILPHESALSRGDAAGLLRVAREWRYVVRARKFRRKLRALRNRRAREMRS